MNNMYIIAEAEINHNGDMEIAQKMIATAKECGADCVKFQYIIADEIADPSSKFYELFKNVEFSSDQFRELKDFAENEIGIDFMMTVPSVKTVCLTRGLGITKIKIGSSNLTNVILLREIAKHKSEIEIYLSTGMGTLSDIELALKELNFQVDDKNFNLFHCTVNYPADFDNLNLNAIKTMKDVFKNLPIGYSDHTNGSLAAVVSLSLGAELFEKHFTLDKTMEGPDHGFSTPPEEFKQYIMDLKNSQLALGDTDKGPAVSEVDMLRNARRFLIVNRDIAQGEVFTEQMFNTKRVGDAESPVEVKFIDIISKLKAPRNYKDGDVLNWSDF